MHRDLVKVQEKIVENIGENLKTLEISDKRPVIVSLLAIAERPLAEEEIAARARLGSKEVRKGLGSLLKKDLVVESAAGASGRVGYELSPEVEKMALRNVRSKIEAVRSRLESHVAECEGLLESGKAEFDDYDSLMAKYLREKIKRMKAVSTIMTRRTALLRLLDSSAEEKAEIKRITID
jgi:predicted DNA-binding transcriptional regulator